MPVRDSKGRFISARSIMATQIVRQAILPPLPEDEAEDDSPIGLDGAITVQAPAKLCLVCGTPSDNNICTECADHWKEHGASPRKVLQKYWDTIPRAPYGTPDAECPHTLEFGFKFGIDFRPDAFFPYPLMRMSLGGDSIEGSITFHRLHVTIYAALRGPKSTEWWLELPSTEPGYRDAMLRMLERKNTDVFRNGMKIFLKHYEQYSKEWLESHGHGDESPWMPTENQRAEAIKKMKDDAQSSAVHLIWHRDWNAPGFMHVNGQSCWWNHGNQGRSRCVAKAAGAFSVVDRTSHMRIVVMPVLRSGTVFTPAFDQDTGLYANPDALILYNGYIRRGVYDQNNLPKQVPAPADAGVHGSSSEVVAEEIAKHLMKNSDEKLLALRINELKINRKGYQSYINGGSGAIIIRAADAARSYSNVSVNVAGECTVEHR